MPCPSTACGVASLPFNNRVGYFFGNATAEGYALMRQTGPCSGAVDKRGGTTLIAEDMLSTRLDLDTLSSLVQAARSGMQEFGACPR